MISLSDSEKRFIVQGIAQDVRIDGRANLDYRHVTIECGLLPLAHGSAKVSIVNGSTEILAAVKVELEKPRPERPGEGTIECNVECWSTASPQFAGKLAADINAELTSIMNRTLAQSKTVDLTQLCVFPGKFAWKVYVDLVVLDSGGALVDCLALAAVAALADTRMPAVRVLADGGSLAAATAALSLGGAKTGGAAADAAGSKVGPAAGPSEQSFQSLDSLDVDIDVEDDPSAFVPFPVQGLPVLMTFSQVQGNILIDARLEEEACADSRIQIAINRKGHVCSVQTEGSGTVDPNTVLAAVRAGGRLAPQLFQQIDRALEAAAASAEDVDGEEEEEEEEGAGELSSEEEGEEAGMQEEEKKGSGAAGKKKAAGGLQRHRPGGAVGGGGGKRTLLDSVGNTALLRFAASKTAANAAEAAALEEAMYADA